MRELKMPTMWQTVRLKPLTGMGNHASNARDPLPSLTSKKVNVRSARLGIKSGSMGKNVVRSLEILTIEEKRISFCFSLARTLKKFSLKSPMARSALKLDPSMMASSVFHAKSPTSCMTLRIKTVPPAKEMNSSTRRLTCACLRKPRTLMQPGRRKTQTPSRG